MIPLAVVLGIAVWFGTVDSAPKAKVTLLAGGHLPARNAPLEKLRQKLGAVCNWFSGIKVRVFGPPKTVTISADFIDFILSPELLKSNLPPTKPQFTDGKGLRVWTLSSNELRSLRQWLIRTPGCHYLFNPEITTLEGHQSQMQAVGLVPLVKIRDGVGALDRTAEVGVTADCIARLRSSYIDLMAELTITEVRTNEALRNLPSATGQFTSIQTNFHIAARIYIPDAGGAFILNDRTNASLRKIQGAIISANSNRKR